MKTQRKAKIKKVFGKPKIDQQNSRFKVKSKEEYCEMLKQEFSFIPDNLFKPNPRLPQQDFDESSTDGN